MLILTLAVVYDMSSASYFVRNFVVQNFSTLTIIVILFVLKFYGRQPIGVMSSAVSLPNHTFSGQA